MPILKIKKDGAWETIGGGAASIGNITNADTLDGKPAAYYALKSDVTELQNNINNNTAAIDTLNGDNTLEGSVQYAISRYASAHDEEYAEYKESVTQQFANHNHDDTYDTKGSAASALTSAQAYTDNAIIAKADASHDHAIDNVSGLSDALNGKSDGSHNHDGVYDVAGSAANQIGAHNTSEESHSDIRALVGELTEQVNAFLDVDDNARDQLSEVLNLIDANKGTLESITSGKVNTSDIVDDLKTEDATKVLSANQGTVIKGLIDGLRDTKVSQEEGKGLSTEDYTSAEKQKLASIQEGANAYTHPNDYTAYDVNLYKVAVDTSGHVTGATVVNPQDIIDLGAASSEALGEVSNAFTQYKNENAQRFSNYDTQVEKHEEAIATLNGENTVNGSVKNSVDNAINEFTVSEFNPLSEKVGGIESDFARYKESVSGQFDTINGRVGTVETDLANYKVNVTGQFAGVNDTISAHISAENPHGITKEHLGLENVEQDISDLSDRIDAVEEDIGDIQDALEEHSHDEYAPADGVVYVSEENSEAVVAPLNADTLGGNLPEYYAKQEDYISSLCFAQYVMKNDQTIAKADTPQNVIWKESSKYGNLFTLSDDGTTVTVGKKMIARISAYLYFCNAFAVGDCVWIRCYVNDVEIARACTTMDRTSPYATHELILDSVILNEGDTVKIKVYDDKTAGGLVKSYITTSRFYICARGIIE